MIEYELREVKKTERDAEGGKLRQNGETIVKRLAGDPKRIKRNRSRNTFKMRLGMGMTLEQSGDGLVDKPGLYLNLVPFEYDNNWYIFFPMNL